MFLSVLQTDSQIFNLVLLGMKFAIAQIKTAIVGIVRNFNLTLGANMKEPLGLQKTFFGIPEQDITVNFDPLPEE